MVMMNKGWFVLFVLGAMAMGQSARADEDEPQKNWWGGVNVKYWAIDYKPGTLASSKTSQVMPTIAIGYKDFFYTLTFTGTQTVKNANYPNGQIQFQEESSGFGYNVNQNVAVLIGVKAFAEMYPGAMNRTAYRTGAILFNWAVPDMPIILHGNIGAGSGTTQPAPYNKNARAYKGYEFGVSYVVMPGVKAGVGYKAEDFELPYGANSTPGTARKSGFYAGLGYSF